MAGNSAVQLSAQDAPASFSGPSLGKDPLALDALRLSGAGSVYVMMPKDNNLLQMARVRHGRRQRPDERTDVAPLQ